MDGSRPYVLVVNEVAVEADCLALLLDLWGYDAQPLHGGAALLAAPRGRRPDVVLLEVVLPGTRGFQVARDYRDLPGCGATAVVAVAGSEMQALQAREEGIGDTLVRPFDACLLHELLERLIVRPGPKCVLAEPRREKKKLQALRGG